MIDYKEKFIRTAQHYIKRPGLTEFLAWLESTDFFTAPASTRYHGSFESGLVIHSLNVYYALIDLIDCFEECEASAESIAIVSLFHDVCKANVYKTEMRWRKNQQNQWEQYPTYKFDEDFAFGGHGSKSVFLIQSFMNLTAEEAAAINCHMGQWDATTYSNPTRVYETNLLAWLLHVADEAASFIFDKKEENDD